jgi:hypothetical protein
MILIILLITILILLFYKKETFTELALTETNQSSQEFINQTNESSQEFINQSKPYKSYTISDGENEYVLVSYSLLSFNLKQNILNAIKNNKLDINKNIFDLDSQIELINLKSNISQQNDYVFAVKKSLLLDEQKINNDSKIIFDENNNPKYLFFSDSTKNVTDTIKLENDTNLNAQLYLDDNMNLTITHEKNPINKDLNLKLVTIENNKIMNNNVLLEQINDSEIYKVSLTREPTNFILKEEILNI